MRQMPWILTLLTQFVFSGAVQAASTERVFELVDEGDDRSTMVITVGALPEPLVANMWGSLTFMVDDAAGTWELTDMDITIQDLLGGAVEDLWFRYPFEGGPESVIGEEGSTVVTFDAESTTCETCTDYAGHFHADSHAIAGILSVDLMQNAVLDLTHTQDEIDLMLTLNFEFFLIELADVDVNIHAVHTVPEPGSATGAVAAIGALGLLFRRRRR